MSGLGRQLLDSDAATAERETLGFDSSLFGAAGVPAPIFQALVPRKAGVFDGYTHTFGTGDEPASFTRASNGLYRNAAGAWAIAADDEIRAEHDPNGLFLGYLFEPESTNDFLNSAAPVTQDIALGTGTFTLSVHGTGSVTSSDGTGTASGHGAATDGSPVTIVVSGAGTITFTVAGSPTYVQVEEAAVPSSPIITAGSSATRAKDALGWGREPAGFEHAQGMASLCLALTSAWVAMPNNRPALALRLSNGGTVISMVAGATQQYGISDGASQNNAPPAGGSTAPGEQIRIVSRWSGSAKAIGIYDGAWNWKSGTYDGAFSGPTQVHICLNTVIPIYCCMVALWNRDIGQTLIEELFRL